MGTAMPGSSSVEYLILRSLAHHDNLATEAELDAAFGDVSTASLDDALPKMQKLIDRFGGNLPLAPGLRYLDMGCGTGELTVALARLSGGEVTGVDFLPRNIERARAFAAKAGAAQPTRANPQQAPQQVQQRVQFTCRDLREWQPAAGEKFDVLLSFDAFEHIDSPRAFLTRMADFLAPGGAAVLAFGPLFHSPFGDHMWDFFRIQIPWRGVLFSESVILRLRRECFRPTDPAVRYQDINGGLNLLRYSDFLADVEASGWRFDYLAVNTFLRRWPLLQHLSDWLMRQPACRDYFAHNVYAVLRRTDVGGTEGR
jgi:SAM-dependent methyltransferase